MCVSAAPATAAAATHPVQCTAAAAGENWSIRPPRSSRLSDERAGRGLCIRAFANRRVYDVYRCRIGYGVCGMMMMMRVFEVARRRDGV